MQMKNPFKIQPNNKKFFTQLSQSPLDSIWQVPQDESRNRIKRINMQLQQLSKKKEQMLFKQQQLDYIFKKQQPSLALDSFAKDKEQKDKKFRVRALLKEKKESIHDFLNKKKQIYLSKMNINIKKQQTQKLQDTIKDQQENLKAKKLYFENDVEFIHRFIDGIKKQAEEAQIAQQKQLKTQEDLVSKISALDAEAEKIDNLKSKDWQVLNNLKRYKAFIEQFNSKILNSTRYIRKRNEDPLYLTQNIDQEGQQEQFIINFQPHDLLKIFQKQQENNIQQIQNLHDQEDQLETISAEQKKQMKQLDNLMKENVEKLDALEIRYEKKNQQCLRLREMRKNNNNKISVIDNEDLDLDKIGKEIFDIFREVNPKRASQIGKPQQKQLKKAMTEIQHQIQKLRQLITKEKLSHPNLVAEIEKDIKQIQKKKNLARNRQQAELLELQKQKEQEKKRKEGQTQKLKGRKDMRKVLIEKKVQKKKQVDVKADNDEEKYLIDE